MNILRTEAEDVSTVNVSGIAELRDATDLKAALIESLDRRCPTVIDLSGIQRADVATLQLICSAVRSFSDAAVPLSIAGAGDSGTFQTIAHAAGFPAFAQSAQEWTGEKTI
jgi:ABC-type transporter Mla MlaB component